MNTRQICLYLALCPGFISAQNDDKAEIRGIVNDPALNLGVTGAEITLFEFLLDAEKTVVRTQIATTSTDTRGEFRFPLAHFGEYFVDVKKEGYSIPVFMPGGNPPEMTGTRADVNRDHPSLNLRFSLTRPGEITGRAIDDDGNPLAGRRVGVQNVAQPYASDVGPGTVTDQNGFFTTGKLPAGQYAVRLSPRAGDSESVTANFSADDLKIVDQDFDSAATEPVPVSPGVAASVGTITVHKVPYYRAHIPIAEADCGPKDSLRFYAIPKGSAMNRFTSIPCANDLLIRNLKPGAYWFVLQRDKPDHAGWAVAETEISRENVDVPMVMAGAAAINGRFLAAEGASLPAFQKNTVMMRAHLGSLTAWANIGTVNADGTFAVRNLPPLPHDISVAGLPGNYYVKEIRYNGSAASGREPVRVAPDAANQGLEIVLDDKAATITGSVRDGDQPASTPFVLVLKWPFQAGDFLSNPERPQGDEQGRFQVSGLAPGEYRVIALTKNLLSTQISSQLLARAEKVIVERGSLKDVLLKLIDPAQ